MNPAEEADHDGLSCLHGFAGQGVAGVGRRAPADGAPRLRPPRAGRSGAPRRPASRSRSPDHQREAPDALRGARRRVALLRVRRREAPAHADPGRLAALLRRAARALPRSSQARPAALDRRRALPRRPLARLISTLTNLFRSDLFGSDLMRSDLFGSDLFGSDLFGSDLFGSDLLRSDLEWVARG